MANLVQLKRLDSRSDEVELYNSDQKLKSVEIYRISDLPDEVVSRILSLLPTKDAVATSVLSRQWRSIWTLVPNLEFSSWSSRETESFLRFFWERVQPLDKSFSEVKLRGKLSCSIGDLFRDIISRDVRELDLGIFIEEPVGFYHDILSSETLVSLKLRRVSFNVPISVHLPCLKILHLQEIGNINDESFSEFISGCPVLEDMLLSKYSRREELRLPLALFTSQTLVSLKLSSRILLYFPSPIYLPRLKILHVQTYSMVWEEETSQLLSGCPLLQELYLGNCSEEEEPMEFPDNLFISKTLTSLRLDGNISLEVPSFVHLPRLKILHLGRFDSMHAEFLTGLLSVCPVLEEMDLRDALSDNGKSLCMCIPTLERLRLDLLSSYPSNYELQITAPNLKRLEILCDYFHGETDWNFPNLTEASVGFYYQIPRKLLSDVKNTKILKLHRNYYGHSQPPLNIDFIPKLQNLEYLEIVDPVSLVRFLPEILDNSDNLQKLIILGKRVRCDVPWSAPQRVPYCLLHSLRVFHIDCFEGLNGEMQMVNYILKKSRVLERVAISFLLLDADQKLRVQEKLSAIPRFSSTSELDFI